LHKNGRPDVNTQNQIKNILLQCYEDGLSAYYTTKKTGYNIKTVYKYFNDWSEEIEESEMDDYLERQKRERIKTIVAYDSQLDETAKLLSQVNLEIESSIKEKKSIPKHLLGYKLEIMKFKALLLEKKTGFSMQPTMNEAMIKKVKEAMEKHDRS
jgi:hypothetical protein